MIEASPNNSSCHRCHDLSERGLGVNCAWRRIEQCNRLAHKLFSTHQPKRAHSSIRPVYHVRTSGYPKLARRFLIWVIFSRAGLYSTISKNSTQMSAILVSDAKLHHILLMADFFQDKRYLSVTM